MANKYYIYFKRTNGTLKYFRWIITVEKLSNTKLRWTLDDDFRFGSANTTFDNSGQGTRATTDKLWSYNANNYINFYVNDSLAYQRNTGATSQTVTVREVTVASGGTLKFSVTVNNGSNNSSMISYAATGSSLTTAPSTISSTTATITGASGGSSVVPSGTIPTGSSSDQEVKVYWVAG